MLELLNNSFAQPIDGSFLGCIGLLLDQSSVGSVLGWISSWLDCSLVGSVLGQIGSWLDQSQSLVGLVHG